MRAMTARIFIAFGILIPTLVTALDTKTSEHCYKDEPSPKWSFPVGDPRYCLQQDKDLLRMEVLPGAGWDNLRNLNMGMVIWKNYSQCLTSEDGKYLIPDNTYVVPLKESNVVLNSEVFDHWNNYSSMTSNSINVEAHGGAFGIEASGKFSSEHISVKKHQVEDKAVTTRVQLRYKFYTVKTQPDMQLHPDFKSRLLDIAANLQCNNTAVARYMADLIVRDYGTHYITSIDGGAILAKIDHIKSNYASTFQMDKSKFTASASASFFGAFGVSASYTHQTSTADLDTYTKNIAHSEIHTFGGPAYRANFSLNQWEDGLPNNLIAIDKAGDPLHYAITPKSFPELPGTLAMYLSQFIFRSIKTYFKHNSIKGCTDPSSPNFNFQAILDDHSCESPYNNFTFGGVYQQCSVSGSPSSNPCGSYLQKNPKTSDYTCPSGYEAILVHRGSTPTTCHQECHGWWIFKSCETDCGYAYYYTYWCSAYGTVADHSGYLFGGLYNKVNVNPLTGTSSCPPKFYPQHFGPEGSYVCISDDYELASRYSIPFAGFFSCSSGNPLALENRGLSKGKGLESTLHEAGPSSWPKHCPVGYTQHLAVIDENCEINYCIKANSLSAQGLAPVKRPPFRSPPKMNKNITIPLTIVNDDVNKIYFREPGSLKWIEATESVVLKHLAATDITKGAIDNLKKATKRINETIMKYIAEISINERAIDNLNAASERINPQAKSSKKDTDSAMSSGSAVGIAIAVIAVLVIVAVVIYRRRKSANSHFVPDASNASYQQLGGNRT